MSEAEILALERTIGRAIPTPYRAFLAKHGSGCPPKRRHPPVDVPWPAIKNGFEVDSFLGLPTRESLASQLKRLRESESPETLFPVVEAVGGDLVCLDEADSKSELVYWDHEESDPAEATVALGETLEQFFERLRR